MLRFVGTLLYPCDAGSAEEDMAAVVGRQAVVEEQGLETEVEGASKRGKDVRRKPKHG